MLGVCIYRTYVPGMTYLYGAPSEIEFTTPAAAIIDSCKNFAPRITLIYVIGPNTNSFVTF